MKQKLALAVGALVSIACLVYVFKKVDFGDLVRALGSFNPLWLVPSVGIFLFSMYVRAARWALLFRPHHRLLGRRLFRPTMIGFAFNNILPSGRVGEFVRAFYVGRRESTGLPTALATIVTERIFDGLTLLGCLALSFAFMPAIDPAAHVHFWSFDVSGDDLRVYMRKIIWGCGVLAAAVVLFIIPAVPRFFVRIVERMPRLPEEFKKPIAGAILGVARGFESVREPAALAGIVGYSILLWGLIALSTLALSYGFPTLSMNYLHALAIMALVAVFIIIPAAPGYWGLYEAGMLFSLKVLSVEQDESIAAAFAIVMHLVQFVPVVVIGLIFAAQDQVRVSRIAREAGGEAP